MHSSVISNDLEKDFFKWLQLDLKQQPLSS